MSKAPKPGSVVPDSKIHSLEEGGADSTLLTEARKVAKAAKSDKVMLCFDAVTGKRFMLTTYHSPQTPVVSTGTADSRTVTSTRARQQTTQNLVRSQTHLS